ncbi:MAG: hypothetical protein ACKO8I_17560 [Cyanobacteriota bacterium]
MPYTSTGAIGSPSVAVVSMTIALLIALAGSLVLMTVIVKRLEKQV